MLDIKFIRENPEVVKENLKKKFQDEKIVLVDELLKEDELYRSLLSQSQELRSKRNKLSESINKTKKEGGDIAPILAEVKEIPTKIKLLEEEMDKLQELIKEKQLVIPNIIHESVPIGKDEEENVEVKTFGKIEKKDFEIKSHNEVAENLGVADFDSARETSGNGFYFLKGDLAEMEEALRQYAMDFMKKKGYTFVVPPNLIRSDVVTGVMSFAEMDAMMYKMEGEDLYAIGTSEHSMIGMFKDRVLKKDALPIKIFGNTTCYRKEGGSHGLDEKGLFRVHQFNKVEQIIICEPEESYKYYDELLQNTVNLFKGLDLPIRILECCSGDLADLKAKSADVEAWSPRRDAYIEVASCTNMTDAQSRRLGIKVDGGPGNRYHAHTLNDTAIATSRAMVAILENNQNADGTVDIPKVLQPYMGGKKVISKLEPWFW